MVKFNKSKKKSGKIQKKDMNDIQKTLSLYQDEENPNLYNLILLIKPNARENRLFREGEHFCLNISAPPVKGKANIAIIKFLSAKLKISKSAIRIVRGHTASTKTLILEISNSSIEEVTQKLIK
ncbi:DUF167 domain-containing protein [Candidatus Lokiarchaeum ossiferum]|uniref:DUF167 domain-containing protein n=1 Tax=Candidatus Lokiarchaeum ossiferum TaxID=2951803 RepID=UPI00352E6464